MPTEIQKPIKMVRFNPRVNARRINGRHSLTDKMKERLWVSQEDLTKNKARFVIINEEDGVILHSSKGRRETTRRIKRARKAVFKGQKLQNRFGVGVDQLMNGGVTQRYHDLGDGRFEQGEAIAMLIALRYKRYTESCTIDAQIRGLDLARYIKECYSEYQESHGSDSSSTKEKEEEEEEETLVESVDTPNDDSSSSDSSSSNSNASDPVKEPKLQKESKENINPENISFTEENDVKIGRNKPNTLSLCEAITILRKATFEEGEENKEYTDKQEEKCNTLCSSQVNLTGARAA